MRTGKSRELRSRQGGFTVAVLRKTWNDFEHSLRDVEFELWTESVFRWHYIRAARVLYPNVRLQLEWNFFDLLAQEKTRNHLIEFKFFSRSKHRFLDGSEWRWKGGPGTKNFGEFQKNVRKLAEYETAKWRVLPQNAAPIDECQLIVVFPHRTEWSGKKSYCYQDWYSDQMPQFDDVDLMKRILVRPHGLNPIRVESKEGDIELHCVLFDVRKD